MESSVDSGSFDLNNNDQKLLGHRRRPSIGKSMPITSLLLNFSSASQVKNSHRDGSTPEKERPPIFFRINELNNEETNSNQSNKSDTESCDENIEEDYEILISECSSSSSDDNEDVCANNDVLSRKISKSDDQILLIGNSKFYTPSLTCNPASETTVLSPPPVKIQTNLEETMANNNKNPFQNLCEKLCNQDCKTSLSNFNVLPDLEDLGNITACSSGTNRIESLKIPNKLDLERTKFLNEMLDAEQDDSSSGDDNEDVDETDIVVVQEANLMLKDFREKFMIAEALNKTSMMTSPAAKRRLAARKIEMELDFDQNGRHKSDIIDGDDDYVKLNKEFIPPRELLLYLVRMGSFNSAPKISNLDSQDDNLVLPQGLTISDLIDHCKHLRGTNRPQLLTRYFLKPTQDMKINQLTEEFHVFNINAVSKACSPPVSSPKHLRILQWNILSQSLGQNNDGFVCCPDEALTWENRKFLIIEEILQNNPDIICLQEVDHFKFLEKILGSQGYNGIFFPKPDSPCLYIEENNGPDGCAIFYKCDKFQLINNNTRILEVWHVQSNQVAIIANLRIRETDIEFSVCTTHLKARHGALLSKLRNEQGKDLLKFITNYNENRPVILCGDFNAEPIEPVYSTVLNNNLLQLSSAYADISDIISYDKETKSVAEDIENQSENIAVNLAQKEPPYTTWKIREDGEVCHTIDYVFYSKNHFKVNNCLLFPQEDEIGKNRTPSFQYPSDHFSLVCDFEILEQNKHKQQNINIKPETTNIE